MSLRSLSVYMDTGTPSKPRTALAYRLSSLNPRQLRRELNKAHKQQTIGACRLIPVVR